MYSLSLAYDSRTYSGPVAGFGVRSRRTRPSSTPPSILSSARPREVCATVPTLGHASSETHDCSSVWNISRSSSPSLSLPLKLSTHPFSHGDPGSIYRVLAPAPPSHSRTALEVNSGPLSGRMCPGTPNGYHQSGKGFNNIRGADAASCPDGQALPGVLVNDGQPDERQLVLPVASISFAGRDRVNQSGTEVLD